MSCPYPRVVGVVVAPGPTALGSQHLHGVRLVDHALQSLSRVPDCDVVVVGAWPTVADRTCRPALEGVRTASPQLAVSRLVFGYDVVLVHDPLCPLVPVASLSACVDAVDAAGAAAIGVLPVTDTVKRVHGDVITSTVDRDALRVLASPVVFTASLVPALEHRVPRARHLGDLGQLVDVLGDVATLVAVQVPSLARRVGDTEDIAVLECLDGLRHSLRER